MKKVRTIVILIFIVFSNLSASNNWKLVDSINYEFGSIMRLKCYDSLNCMYFVEKGINGGFHLQRTMDGGRTWKKVYMDSTYFHNMKDYHFVPKLNDLSYPNEKLCIAVGDSGLVLRSTDKGETWDVFRTDTNLENHTIVMYDEQNGIMPMTEYGTNPNRLRLSIYASSHASRIAVFPSVHCIFNRFAFFHSSHFTCRNYFYVSYD